MDIITWITLVCSIISAFGVVTGLVISYIQSIRHIKIANFSISRRSRDAYMSFRIENFSSKTVLLTSLEFRFQGQHVETQSSPLHNSFSIPTRLDEGAAIWIGYNLAPQQNIDEIIIKSTSRINGIHKTKSFPQVSNLNK